MVMIKKYDIEREAQGKQDETDFSSVPSPKFTSHSAKWFLETVSGLKCEFQDNFQASLKDGVLLATAMNAILEKAADDSTYGQSIKIKGGKPPKMPFQQMELIGQFLSKMEKLGVPSHDRFLTVDLYENKDMNQVNELSGLTFPHSPTHSFIQPGH